MLFNKNTSEAYWNSYRLLEKQLIRISHTICFDDEQIDVYSSELADIINSACIKIESLAKDIYENHIFPFQIDTGIIPSSFKGDASKFNEKWTREKWKYDYNCLVEIDKKFSLSKKNVQLKFERFHFSKYGTTILPFFNISNDKCCGGKWEHNDGFDIWNPPSNKLIDVDWCKSYQDIKHNYIQSIPKHGTVKNSIMVLAAFYLLAIYNTCLPYKHFDWNDKNDEYKLDFGSDLFSCGMCNYTIPPCVINSNHIKRKKIIEESIQNSPQREVLEQQNILGDIVGLPFLLILNDSSLKIVKKLVNDYCISNNLECFDIAPYENANIDIPMTDGMALYLKIKEYIQPPYHPNNICVAFNIGLNEVYEYRENGFEYEKSKYRIKTKDVLSTLKSGDFVDAKFIFEIVANGEVKKINEYTIELMVDVNGEKKTLIEPIGNIIYIKKLNKI